MKNKLKKVLAGGIMATCVAVPTSLFFNQRKINLSIQEQRRIEKESYTFQLQEHEEQAESLTKQLEELGAKVDGLSQVNKELQSKNNDLEGVRSIILNNLGYEIKAGELDLLQRLVESEAGAESMEGRVAVVNVILNRVKSEKFPNTLTAVIYQENQFEPIVTGTIYQKTASAESKEAVKRALMGERSIPEDIMYFWASWLESNNPLWGHVGVAYTIGLHHFGRVWN